MAGSPRPGCVRRLGFGVLALLALWGPSVRAQTTLKLQHVNDRNPAPDFAPAHEHQKVSVTGIVNAYPFHFPSYSLVSIEADGCGAVVKVTDSRLDGFLPGDEITVDGTIEAFSGMPVIAP